MSTASKISLAALLVMGISGAGFCETVFQLKNGDRITGRILSEDTNQVVIATAWSKEMVLPLALISKREEAPATGTNVGGTNNSIAITPSPVLNTNAPVLAGTNTTLVATNIPTLAGTNAPAKTNAPALAAAPSKPVPAKPPKQWDFEIQLGASVQYNQVSSDTYTGVGKANYRSDFLRDIVEYNGSYGRTGTNVSMNRMTGSNRTEHDIDPQRRAFIFNAVSAGYDLVRKIDLTYDDSFGVGYKLFTKPTFALSGDFGANYQEQWFQDNTRKDYVSLRVGESLSWMINPRITLEQKTEFYPHLTGFGDFRVRSESNLSYKLNQKGTLYLIGSVIDIYDTKPARGVLPNDLQITSRLGMKF